MARDEKDKRPSGIVLLAIRFLINALALWLAAELLPGLDIADWKALLGTALIFGLVNAVIKPFVKLIGLPLTCLTLGLFALVINTLMLLLAVWLASLLDLAVEVENIMWAFVAALIVAVVSTILNTLLGTTDE